MASNIKNEVERADLEVLARDCVLSLSRQEYEQARKNFNANMAVAATTDVLQQLWDELLQESGAFQTIIETQSEAKNPYRKTSVLCQFETCRSAVAFLFDDDDKIASLDVEHEYSAPDYAKWDAFEELDVEFGQGEWVLPGTLSVPKGIWPFPAVVLVHGSGPNDRDESVGAAKPFRDLAWGLSSNGIAVLRYEKRTRHYAGKIAGLQSFTVWEETIVDAVEAVAFLRRREEVKEDSVFVLGHSLGATMIPRIAAESNEAAGFIVMAAAGRPLEELLLDQTLYHASLVDELSPEDEAKVEEIRKTVAVISTISKGHDSSDFIYGAPPSYWLDLKGYEPAEDAKTIQRPMLLLHGKKDYQCQYDKDFGVWQRALGEKTNVESRAYPSLNHLFIAVEGQSTGAEYRDPGNLDEAVVEDIAGWIMRVSE